MKKHIIFILWSLLLPCIILANNSAGNANMTESGIYGHILNKATGEHVPFLVVSLKGTTIATTSNESGHYFLEHLPTGKFIVQASGMGYKTVSKEVNIVEGVSLEVNFYIEEDNILLDGVVVSANRSETARLMAPTLVNVIGMETFDRVNATTVSQGLNFQPGVRVENNCQNCSYQQVRINGLDGPYTQILIDSRPVFSALAGVYGIEQLPANMVDRVEVMRGGGSALFGSSAIAGTINIITKEPVRNSASISHTVTNFNGKGAFDNNTSLNASLVTDDNKMGIAVFGQNRQKDGYDHNGDGFTELTELKSQTIGMRGYLKTGVYSKLTAEYHHLQEYRRGGDSLQLPPHEVMIAEQVRHSINTASLKYDQFTANQRHHLSLFASMQHIDRESYYGAGKDPNAYGQTSDLTWVVGGQYVYKMNKCLFMPSDLTVGIEYNQDHLKDNMWGYNRVTDQMVRIASLYFQNEWKNDKWGFLLGGRLDKHNLIDGIIFSPRANIRFNPTKNVNLRASYSYGFRAPQAFDEDLHIDNVGGTVSMIVLADDLKVEKSQSLSLSADMYKSWGEWQGNLCVEGFYTDLSDVFALTELGVNAEGVLIKERRNESGARVYGGNIEGKIAYKDKWQMQLGATVQSSEYKEAHAWADDVEAVKQMFRTPDVYGYFVTSYNPVKQFMLSLSGTYTGSMLMEHHAGWISENRTEKTKGFFDMNIKAAYDFSIYKNIKLQLNAGIQNIFNSFQDDFDCGPDRDSGYIYGPTAPRSFYFGIKISY